MAKKHKASFIDDFIGIFSPKAKLQRLRFKYTADVLKRKYEGADAGRRTQGWLTASTSANAETSGALNRLRNRSRDLVRNNPYAARGVQGITANVIGKGIMSQFKHKTQSRERRLNDAWRAWAGTTACDFEGKHSFAGLQRLIMRSVVEGGECLVRLRRVGRQTAIAPNGQEVEVPPIQLQVLEGDFIDSSSLSGVRAETGNKVIQGVEFQDGKPVAYKLFENHPGGIDELQNAFRSNFVPASEIRHIYRTDRPGQVRGVPWLAPVMLRLKDFDEYEDAQLVRQKIAAMYTAFVHDLNGLDPDLSEQEVELCEKMEPGVIEILPPGKDIKLSNPPSVENYREYTSVVLHSIASGLGVTYELLVSDLSQVNFSSARMGWLEFQRNIDAWRWQLFMPQFLNPVTDWFLQSANLIGLRTENMQRVFTPPRREMIDPVKETNALKDAVRSGFLTLSEAVRMGGFDPEAHFEEYQRDMAELDRLGLTLDTDARKGQTEI